MARSVGRRFFNILHAPVDLKDGVILWDGQSTTPDSALWHAGKSAPWNWWDKLACAVQQAAGEDY